MDVIGIPVSILSSGRRSPSLDPSPGTTLPRVVLAARKPEACDAVATALRAAGVAPVIAFRTGRMY